MLGWGLIIVEKVQILLGRGKVNWPPCLMSNMWVLANQGKKDFLFAINFRINREFQMQRLLHVFTRVRHTYMRGDADACPDWTTVQLEN